MLRIVRVSAGMGGVDYLLRAAGCAEHDHLPKTRDASSKGAEYLLAGSEHGEPDGVWHGAGLEMLGLAPNTKVTADQMRTVYGRLEHCAPGREGESLGRRPRQYASFDDRLAAALAEEPLASEERREQIRRRVKASQQEAVGYYDVNVSPSKSISVWEKVLRAAGRHAEADAVVAAHAQATQEMIDYLQANVTTTRVGSHVSVTLDDGTRTTIGEYAKITGLVVTIWQHSSSREGDPHLHSHCAVLNRVMTEDGQIYALDAQQFKALKGSAAVLYERRMEEIVTETTGAQFGWRPDGKSREIVGLDRELCDESSGRKAMIQARLDKLVAEYVDEHGHEPGRQALAAMRKEAWNTKRAPKSLLSPAAITERYVLKHGEAKLAEQVEHVAKAAKDLAAAGGVCPGQPQFETEDAMLKEAVRRTQQQYATWDETALALEINKLIGTVTWGSDAAANIDRLVARAVAPDGPADVLPLAGHERVRVPQALRENNDPAGQPVYRQASSRRYATRGHIAAEQQLVAEAHLDVAPKLDEAKVADLTEELTTAGLGADQLNAVMGILNSGKAADVLIGPAGAGKSKTVGQLDRVWRENFDGPVLGLATSQRATEVLKGEGLDALNTAQFLTKYMPQDGRPATEQLPPRTLLVVDEAGMADTGQLAQIAKLVRESGGKLLYTGDHEQLAAVGTGGLLRLMTRDACPFELTQVWRFHAAWEREASLKFRAGDPAALDAYEQRGRLRGGTKADMADAAVRGYMADVLDGKESVLVVKSNEDANDLSARVRAELIALGKVGNDDLAVLAGDLACGVGDLVAARKNDHRADSANKQMLVNRELLTVTGVDNRGHLECVRRSDGTKVWLSPDYYRKYVSLAYAGTVHSVQGRTTDTSHSLVERGMSRNSAYVEATRGREANFLYAVTEVAADEHDHQDYSVSAADVLREVLAADGAQVSAVETWRAELENADSLESMGAVWNLAAGEAMAHAHRDALVSLVGRDTTQWMVDEPGHDRLLATLKHAELSGHDVPALLTAAVASDLRGFADAGSMSAVLRGRVQKIVKAAGERRAPGRWTGRLRSYAGTIGEYAQELAQEMDKRVEMMARAAVMAPPEWALVQLGPVPDESDMQARRLWAAKAAAVGSYREMYGVDAEEMSIGPAPSKDQDPTRHVAWQRAWEALGRPEDQADHQTLTEEQLREEVARWDREQAFAPVYVAPEMEKALTCAEEYRRESVLRWAEVRAELDASGGEATAEVQELVEKAERAERLAERFEESATRYERLHETRTRWAEHTAEAAERAQLAAAELERRGLELAEAEVAAEPEEPAAVQLELFDEDGEPVVHVEAGDNAAEAGDDDYVLPDEPPEEYIGFWDVLDVEFDDDAVAEHTPVVETDVEVEEVAETLAAEPDAEVEEPQVSDEIPAAEPDPEPERGDYGTRFLLDDVAVTDDSFPQVFDEDPNQYSLFEVDETARRVTAGDVRPDVDLTVGEAEALARRAEAVMAAEAREAAEAVEKKAQEAKAELLRARAAAAEDERRRVERERLDREAELRRLEAMAEAVEAELDDELELHY